MADAPRAYLEQSSIRHFDLNFPSEERTRVFAGHGTIGQLGRIVSDLPRAPRRVVLACDETTARLFGERIASLLKASAIGVVHLTVPAGERAKTLQHVAESLTTLATERVDRQTMVIAVGGGVVGDLFGFVAACFMRGLRLAHVPTTLIGQVDSSIGGKVGVDLPEGKNLVGVFKHPEFVAIDYDSLTTLPDEEWVAGTAEIVKHGVIANAGLFDLIEQNAVAWRRRSIDPAPILRAAIQVKAHIVQQDEREQGLRMHLNYGHTPGHALEAASGYSGIRHGEAVAWGMAIEARMGARLGTCAAEFVRRQDHLFVQLGLLAPLPRLDPSHVYERLFLDKKTDSGQIRWLLPGPHVGVVQIRSDVPESLVRELIWAAVDGTLLDGPPIE